MDTVPTTIDRWYDKAAHFCLQKEITHRVTIMHQGTTPQTSWYDNPCPQFSHPVHDPSAMDIDALNLSPTEHSCCWCNCLCYICKQPNCSTRNHPHNDTMTHPAWQEQTPARPACNPERVRTTTAMTTSEEGELVKHMKKSERKGRKPTELLHLLQHAVDTDEKEEVSF